MIISQTPARISFLGGGTDYPDHYLQHGGATLATAIDKYTTITVHPLTEFSDHALRVHYSRIESVSSVDELQHPSARECLRLLGIEGGLEIHYVSDLPARTGLGSSSAATVGLLMALHAYQGRMASREQVAHEALTVEQEMIRSGGGSQDQFACALGGLRHLQFGPGGDIRGEPVVVPPERLTQLRERLILLYTGVQRDSHTVLAEQTGRTLAGDNLEHLTALRELVDDGIAVLCGDGPLSGFGECLHEGWQRKRRLSQQIATSAIDDQYDRARRAGAVGGKLLGAGGGGFLLLFAEPDRRADVLAALPELRETRFAFDGSGSQIVFYRP